MARHWPEYLIEAICLGTFMISAGTFGVLLFHPESSFHVSGVAGRVLMGIAMGLTAIAIIYSPLGARSGAHMNPAVTLTYLRLGKIAPRDAAFYIAAQFVGGVLGLTAISLLLREQLAEMSVRYVATLPGMRGAIVAFVAEVVISFLMMTMILNVSNSRTLHRYTGVFAGLLVATFITLEAPLSGMSMNPARTFASAFLAGIWTNLWIYFTAPVIGMLLASGVYRGQVYCGKLNHLGNARCIFRCRFAQLVA